PPPTIYFCLVCTKFSVIRIEIPSFAAIAKYQPRFLAFPRREFNDCLPLYFAIAAKLGISEFNACIERMIGQSFLEKWLNLVFE
ncbi:MAG: hypothetical protein ABF489_07220, partial [Bifidobacterium sp.]